MAFESLAKILDENDVIVFMNGTINAPYCGYAAQICKILEEGSVNFHTEDILANQELKAELFNYTQSSCNPQIFICGEPLGGANEIRNFYENDNLKDILDKNHIKNTY